MKVSFLFLVFSWKDLNYGCLGLTGGGGGGLVGLVASEIRNG